MGAALLAILILAFTLVPPLEGLPVRIPLGLAMVLFLPGYTLIAALFPRRTDLDGIERIALSFGLSIAVVPLIGLGLNYTPWGIRLVPVVISLAIFTIAMAAAAYIRRSMQVPEERFSADLSKSLVRLKDEVPAEGTSRLDKALAVILIITIILSVSALAYVIATPKQGEKFTEFYILGAGGKAYDYPITVIPGNNSTVIVGVVNHEYCLTNYTLQLRFRNETLMSRDLQLVHNQTWEQPVSYLLKDPGHDHKLEFLLYRESNFTASYRDLHLWINAQGGNESEVEMPQANLTAFRHMIKDYSNITTAVFQARKMHHSRGREDLNVTLQKGNQTGTNVSSSKSSEPEVRRSGQQETVQPTSMDLSKVTSKSYPKVNPTLIKSESVLSREVGGNVVPNEPKSGQSQEAPSEAAQAEHQTTQSPGGQGSVDSDGSQFDQTQVASGNAAPGGPQSQSDQPQATSNNAAPGGSQLDQSRATSDNAAQKPIVLGRGPRSDHVVLGGGSQRPPIN